VCTASGQCAPPPEQPQFRVGACYHDTGAWQYTAGEWDLKTANVFIPIYHHPGIREKVRQQLSAMANAKAGVVKTMLWYGDEQTHPQFPTSLVAFPPTAQQLQNLHDFAADVSVTLRPDGQPMELLLSSGFLAAADVSVGDVAQDKVGWDCLTAAEWSLRMTRTYNSVIDAVKTVFRADGLPAVSLMYLWSEVQVCATDDGTDPGCQWAQAAPDGCNIHPQADRTIRNQQWFLKTLYPAFVAAARGAGIIPSIYFNGGNTETGIMDSAFTEPFAPAQPEFVVLDHRRSMAGIFRSAWWMTKHGLPLPERFDVDFYAPAVITTPATLTARFLDDLEAVIPQQFYPGQSFRYAIVEAAHPNEKTARDAVGKAFAAERLRRGANPEIVLFWSTPGSDPTASVAPEQFDFDAFTTAGIVSPFANLNGGFEASADGTAPDHWRLPANAFWNHSGVKAGAADVRFDSSGCTSNCGALQSDRVAVQPGQVVSFQLSQENSFPLTDGPAPTDANFAGMTFALIGSQNGVDGAPLLQFGAMTNSTSYNAPFAPSWQRYGGIAVVPHDVDSVHLRIVQQGTPSGTVMDVDEVR